MATSISRYADGPSAEAETVIDAPPETVWPFVSDPLLMPDLSREVQGVEWLDGAASAAVGARFQGHNAHPAVGEWTTTNTVVECERPRVFAWTVGDLANPTAVWRFTLEPSETGTTLRQTGRMGPGPSGLTGAIEKMPEKELKIVGYRLAEWEKGMVGNLAEIKARAEAAR